MQIGQGVTVADVATQFSQRSLESTSSGLDLAIDGGGFFVVEDAEGSQYFTRAGAFHIDGEGYLVDIGNNRVQGYAPSSPTLGDLNTRNSQSAPDASANFSVGLDLDARTVTGGVFNSSQTVYDTLGRSPHPGRDVHEDRSGRATGGIDRDPGRRRGRLPRITPDSSSTGTAKPRQGLQHDHGRRHRLREAARPRPPSSTGHDGQIYQSGNLVLRRDGCRQLVRPFQLPPIMTTRASRVTARSAATTRWPSTSTVTAAQTSPWPSAAPGPTTTR